MTYNNITIGTHCSFLLPKKVISPFKTPAKGLVTNILLDHSALVLVEEIWLIKNNPLVYCGWVSLPSLLDINDHLMIPAKPDTLLPIREDYLDLLIKQTLNDLLSSIGEKDL